MKKSSIAAVVLTILTTAAGVSLAANDIGGAKSPHHIDAKHTDKMRQVPNKHHKYLLPRGFEQLNLTETQKAQIQAIVQSNDPLPKKRVDAASFKQKVRMRQAAEEKLFSSKHFDEAAARQMILERQQEHLNAEREQGERELQMLKKRHAIFQVLTPTQQNQWHEEQRRRMNHFLNGRK